MFLASAAAAEQLLTFLGTALNSKHAGYDAIMTMMIDDDDDDDDDDDCDDDDCDDDDDDDGDDDDDLSSGDFTKSFQSQHAHLLPPDVVSNAAFGVGVLAIHAPAVVLSRPVLQTLFQLY